MKLRFSCPECGRSLSVDASHEGRRVNCPACNTSILAEASEAIQERPRYPAPPRPREEDWDDAPSRRPRLRDDYDDEEDRPRSRRRDDYDDRRDRAPRRRRRVHSRGGIPGGWITIGVLFGLLALFVGLAFISMDLAIGLFAVGALIILAAGVWFVVVAFQESPATGIMVLFVPFYNIVFLVRRFDVTGKPFFAQLIGAVVCFAATGIIATMHRPDDRPPRADVRPPGIDAPGKGKDAVLEEPGSSERGLRAYWSFDEGKGDKAHDASPARLEATIHGCKWVPGVNGTALQFDGVSNYVSLKTAKGLTFADKAPFTIAAWVKTTKADGMVLSFRRDPDAPWDLLNIFLNGGHLTVWVRQKGDPLLPPTTASTARIDDDKWRHFAVTRSAEGDVTLFLDGAVNARLKADASRIPRGRVFTNLHTLGVEAREVEGRGARLDGCLDELMVFGNVLSEEEIRKYAGR